MNAYFDSSALVKLLFSGEADGDVAFAVAGDADAVVTSRLTFVEARSAVARAQRNRRLSAVQLEAALELLSQVWEDTVVLDVDEPGVLLAGELVLRHNIGSHDAIQLASATAFDVADPPVFVCWDKRLRAAARSEGFELIPA